tara:strand:- start:6322 stop:6501 length:180 start_codon:yes stop_codon:yes gene_type:complete
MLIQKTKKSYLCRTSNAMILLAKMVNLMPGFSLFVGKFGFGESRLGHTDILLLGHGLLS